MPTPKIVVAGAGSIGCFVGGMLAHNGADVSLLGRGSIAALVIKDGLALTDNTGTSLTLTPEQANMSTDPAILASADIILVTVKSGGTADMAELIKQHGKPGATIISLQNGVTNADTLRRILPDHSIRGGMVPFNVLQLPGGGFHRGTDGDIMIDTGDIDLSSVLSTPHMKVIETPDIANVMWGKLLVNLNNALNALAGVPLVEELGNRKWRKILAAQMAEGYAVLDAAGIEPKSAMPLPPKLMRLVLRLPTPLYKTISGRTINIDPKARSSMWEDLQRGRITEIDELQGAIVKLGKAHNVLTPVNAAVLALIKAAETAGEGSPGLAPQSIDLS